MKRLLAAMIAGAALSVAAAPAFAEEVAYKLDSSHTETFFSIDRMGFTSILGLFAQSEGTIWLDEAAPEKSRVEATVAVGSILTANTARDEHLKAERWLNAAKNPTMTFKSTKVEKTGDTTAKVTGDMTVMGVTQPVTRQAQQDRRRQQSKEAGWVHHHRPDQPQGVRPHDRGGRDR